MPIAMLLIIFVILLIIAIPVGIALGITSVLPSLIDPSFTVGAKYMVRAMFGGLDSFPSSCSTYVCIVWNHNGERRNI